MSPLPDKKRLKILYIYRAFFPELGSVRIINEIAFFMAKKGHKVTVITTKSGAGNQPLRSCHNGVNVARVPFRLRDSTFFASSIVNHILLPMMSLPYALASRDNEIVECSNYPMTLWIVGFLIKKLKRSKLAVRVDDVHPQSAAQIGLLKNKYLIKMLNQISKMMYKKSDLIVTHSVENKCLMVQEGANPEKIKVIELWADLESISKLTRNPSPLPPGMFERGFYVTFAGLMSYAQGLEIIVEAARLLKPIEGIRFLMIGKGPVLNSLINSSRGLDNIKFWDFLPQDQYISAIMKSELCLIPLSKGLVQTPSKLLEIMALGKCVVLIASRRSSAARIVKDASCGAVVDPSSPDELARSIISLYNDAPLRKKLGENGAAYVKQNLSLEICGSKYELTFLELRGHCQHLQ